MIPRLDSAVVLGAGTMGAQLACLLAGTGARVRLLDLDGETAARGLERAAKLRPSPVFRAEDFQGIRTGGFDELEAAVVGADWVVEAVVERLEPKRALFERIDAALADVADEAALPLISSNTSGISIFRMAEGRSERFRRSFLGTHFFNPPRYARLLELIPTGDTDPDRVAWIEDVGSRRLGKGTVRAKDRPAFVANRLGVHGLLTALALARETGLGVDEVDDLTGPLIGRPKSAIFRTLDLVGLDVAVAVADHCHEDLVDDPERERFAVPSVLRRLVEEGRLGEKSGAGFYRKDDGEILALDLETLEYRPRRRASSPAVEQARTEPDVRRRLSALVDAASRSPEDPAATFVWRLVASELAYAAAVGPEIAADAESVDRAMRWGFGWEVGPFEAWDALGLDRVAERLPAAGIAIPPLVERVVEGPGRFHEDGQALDFATLELHEVGRRPGSVDLDARKGATPGLPANASASVVDLGDGILGLELHGKLNVIGLDTLDVLRRGLELAQARYDGFVIGTRAADFSAGANLALMLMEAEEGEWDELHRVVRRFQAVTTAMRLSPVPVVVAPRGRTLGGGTELCLAAARRQPLTETYIGLVETGVGLIPAGGGSTAMARDAAERAAGEARADLFSFFRANLETIAAARVSTSAEEARSLGLLGPADLATADPDRQWSDAAATARHLAELGYRPPADLPFPVVGRRGIAAAEALSYNQLLARQMSEHDRTIVLALAGVMSGGDVAEGTLLPAAYLLDLEREAFVRLLGERLTRDRIRHTLKTGKPLRN
ncbi:MAG TPA: 3-hydroxyacyl-CoA dehydrogenase NAD-binding domain-containing protein [Candidatus Limnocylindria bacterium]|nr:3-hydroxyacyl-CoA dehydrogenase NAD-binding domain-containing protein [Candidatus Limnocylindria bacterium]